MTMHVLVARNGDRWGSWLREAATLPWSPLSSDHRLQPLAEGAIDFAFKTTPSMAFTFSDRPFDVVGTDIAEMPEGLASVARNVEITILVREGRLETPDDRWATVHRAANRINDIWSGPNWVFRPQLLKQEALGWFDAESWASFGPPRPHRNDPMPPPWARELYVRHGDGWRARLICPDSFPTFNPGPVVSDEQRARQISRMPQTKSAARRAKHQAADARFKAEAAERARLRGEVV